MDSIITIIIFAIGAIIGGITVHLFKRNSNNIEESESLNDVKDLVKDLSDKISLKEGKDEERYEMVNRLTSAFTGGTKKQGAAGEILLINILQQSGLREGKDFEIQKKFDDEVNGATDAVSTDIAHRQAFSDDALACERSISVNEQRQNRVRKRRINSILA